MPHFEVKKKKTDTVGVLFSRLILEVAIRQRMAGTELQYVMLLTESHEYSPVHFLSVQFGP